MSNGTTRTALAEMQIDGVQNGQHEYIEEIVIERQGKKAMKKIPLKNPTSHNHSK